MKLKTALRRWMVNIETLADVKEAIVDEDEGNSTEEEV